MAEAYEFTLEAIRKSFGAELVLDDLTVTFSSGEFVLVLGANGSGKSTLLRICVGLARPDGGAVKVRVIGSSTASPRSPLPREVGHAGHALFLYSHLTTQENLSFARDLVDPSVDLGEVFSSWKLERWRNHTLSELSKGTQSRVSLARALLHSPPFLFLDEPTSSLDDRALELLMNHIDARAARKSESFTVVTTHDVNRLLPRATRALLLSNGVIRADSAALERSGATSRADALQSVVRLYREDNR